MTPFFGSSQACWSISSSPDLLRGARSSVEVCVLAPLLTTILAPLNFTCFSYIDPRVIALFESDRVIELPDAARPVASTLEIELTADNAVLKLPTDTDGDAVRLEIEQRVHALILKAG